MAHVIQPPVAHNPLFHMREALGDKGTGYSCVPASLRGHEVRATSLHNPALPG